MNREEKEQYVIQLYKEIKSTREIAKLTHLSFRDIGIVTKKVKSEADWKKMILNQNQKLPRLSNYFLNSNPL